MSITDKDLEQIISFITLRTGIIPRESHRAGIRAFIESRLSTISAPNPLMEYRRLLDSDSIEMSNLINESTVNETYFFREEKQFLLLRNKIFPEWTARKGSAQMRIWSAACSTGEEAYSIALLAKACHISAVITASDIDTVVLKTCSAGIYRAQSERKSDGVIFHQLLEPYKTADGGYAMSPEIRNMLQQRCVNLAALDQSSILGVIPEKMNIIFLRNAFIYFSRDLRAKILHVIAEKYLASGGYLFVSMNEVASIDSEITPSTLEKQADGTVFYFRKI